jgi:hypothetical protein
MKDQERAGCLAFIILAVCFAVNVMALCGCSSRKVALQKQSKSTSIDSLAARFAKGKQVDTSKSASFSHYFTKEDYDELITIYPAPGERITIGSDGSLTGKVDSARTRRHGKSQKTLSQSQQEQKGQSLQVAEKSKVNVKSISNQSSGGKTTERQGVDLGLTVGLSIIGMAVLIILGFWISKKIAS